MGVPENVRRRVTYSGVFIPSASCVVESIRGASALPLRIIRQFKGKGEKKSLIIEQVRL